MSMRRPVRVALWVLLLSGSAATGAFIAAHTNPLPPQVRGAASPSTIPSRSPQVKPERWTGTIRSVSYHQLFVGGRCTSNWRTTLSLIVQADGMVSGSGRARLASRGAPCPFAVAQTQIGTFDLEVAGRLAQGVFSLRISEAGHTPSAGADDLGGFRATVLGSGARSTLQVPVRGTSASKTITLSVNGTDRDTFVSTNQIRLRCKGC